LRCYLIGVESFVSDVSFVSFVSFTSFICRMNAFNASLSLGDGGG